MNNKNIITSSEINRILLRGAELSPLPEEQEIQNRLDNIYDKLGGPMTGTPGIWDSLSNEERNNWTAIIQDLEKQDTPTNI